MTNLADCLRAHTRRAADAVGPASPVRAILRARRGRAPGRHRGIDGRAGGREPGGGVSTARARRAARGVQLAPVPAACRAVADRARGGRGVSAFTCLTATRNQGKY